MADMVTMAGSALHRGLELCRILDREHSNEQAHAALRSIRHELETAQGFLSRLGADILPPRDGQAGTDAPETSKAAARAIRTRSGGQRHALLRHLASGGPSADFQMQAALSMSGNTQRPRRYELAQAGYVAPAMDPQGAKLTAANPDTGMRCEVWRLTASGRAALELLNAGQMALFEPEG
jgi:hypothetical protein